MYNVFFFWNYALAETLVDPEYIETGETRMSDLFLTLAAGVALAVFSFSVWASVEKMDRRHLGVPGEKSIFIAPAPVELPRHDMRARIPAQLLNQLEPVRTNVKGEV